MDFSKNGIVTLTDLNKNENFELLNDDPYWNPNLKASFLDGFSTLWDKTYYYEGVSKTPIELQNLEISSAGAK